MSPKPFPVSHLPQMSGVSRSPINPVVKTEVLENPIYFLAYGGSAWATRTVLDFKRAPYFFGNYPRATIFRSSCPLARSLSCSSTNLLPRESKAVESPPT